LPKTLVVIQLITRLTIESAARAQMIDITPSVMEAVSDSGVETGLCFLQVLHTTAGLTINENADPAVQTDILSHLGKIVPFEAPFKHLEGNSDAHIKAALVGFSESFFVERGSLVLGTWQGIYLCEFDGPRRRQVVVKVVADS
jgi:secondary thiamine-phosphate synthase enzyme